MSHDVQWYCPAPLWSERLQNGTRGLRRPVLLQFETDDFMGELQRVLEDAQETLSSQVAEKKEDSYLTFYQPAHQRYYLVTASLVCRERGLPDRAVDTAKQQRAAFVLRRLVPTPDDDSEERREYGWTGAAWKPVEDPTEMANSEKPLKMFPKSYTPQTPVEQMKGDRRMWTGLIPAGKRDTYETAPVRHDDVIRRSTEETDEASENDKEGAPKLPEKGNALSDPRKTKFATRVVGAFDGVRDVLQKPNPTVTAADVRDPLVFAWLDLWQFLGAHFDGMQKTIARGEPIGSDDSDVLRVLAAIDVSGLKKWDTAMDALRAVAANETDAKSGELDGVLKPEELPKTNDELAHANLKAIIDQILAGQVGNFGKDDETPALQEVVESELGVLSDPSKLTDDLKPPTTEAVGAGQYVVRCLYERPKCPPKRRMVVSQRSRKFQLSSFFDADAPARDINIALPSSAMEDLRDSSQTVSMVFTKELRRQAERVQNVTLKKLQNGDAGDAPKVDIGMICSLSIPIITICALVLLLIMVVLLNIVFWWLPFFKICFPLPPSNQ